MLAALLCTLLFSLSAVTARRTTKYLGGTEAEDLVKEMAKKNPKLLK